MFVDAAVDRFFDFMCKRERLRLRKEAGEPWPWSDDDILNAYKFTNVKREHDRTTRWMREHWTGPNEQRPPGEIIFNCALFRYFGTAEFAEAVGWQRNWEPQKVIRTAQERARLGQRVFTGAYIVPTLGSRGPKSEAVCNLILTPFWDAKERLAHTAQSTRSWRAVAQEMFSLPGFGGTGFMTKEVLQDAIKTPALASPVDLNTWCPAGPGARRGLNRIAGRQLSASASAPQLLAEMIELFHAAGPVLPSFMPKLELHDIQFQLCEFDKYERVRLGQGRPRSRYRVK